MQNRCQLEIMLRLLRVIMQNRCQLEIIRRQHHEIMRSLVHQRIIRHQAHLEPIRHQAEAAMEVAAETVVAAVLALADLAHQTTDLDK